MASELEDISRVSSFPAVLPGSHQSSLGHHRSLRWDWKFAPSCQFVVGIPTIGHFSHDFPTSCSIGLITHKAGQRGVARLSWDRWRRVAVGDGSARASCDTPRKSLPPEPPPSPLSQEVRDPEAPLPRWACFHHVHISGPVAVSFPEDRPKNTATESVLPTHILI